MNSANKTLINILLGLVVAVVVGISAGTARGATVNAAALIDMHQPAVATSGQSAR